MTAENHRTSVEEETVGDDKYSFVQADSTPDTVEVRENHNTPELNTEDTYQETDGATFVSHKHTSTGNPAFTDYGTANLAQVALPALFKAMLPKPGDLIQGARSYLPSKFQISNFTDDAYSKASELGRWTYVAGTDLGGKMYNDGYEIGRNAYNGTADWFSSATETGSEYLAESSEKVSEMTSQLGQSDGGSASRGVLNSVLSFAGDHPYALALAGTATVGAILWARGGKKGKKGKTSVRSTTLRSSTA